MTDQEFHEILARYLKGNSNPREEMLVEEFYKSNTGKEIFDDYSDTEEIRIRELLKSNVHLRIRKINEVSKKNPRKWLKVAASIIMVIGLGGIYYSTQLTDSSTQSSPETNYITKATQRGEKATITLSDGSVVVLNAESSITFPKRFTEDQRNITLQGEAFFEVEKDQSRPFTVKTDKLSTQVLGTSFNVNAYPEQEEIQVTVVTGKVKVIVDSDRNGGQTMPSIESMVLTPGFQSTYSKNNHTTSRRQVDADKYLAWKDGVIDFDDVPIREAFDYLERWYDVEINSERVDLSNCHIKSTYTTKSLENIFESLSFINGLEYEKKDKIVTITKSNCQ